MLVDAVESRVSCCPNLQTRTHTVAAHTHLHPVAHSIFNLVLGKCYEFPPGREESITGKWSRFRVCGSMGGRAFSPTSIWWMRRLSDEIVSPGEVSTLNRLDAMVLVVFVGVSWFEHGLFCCTRDSW